MTRRCEFLVIILLATLVGVAALSEPAAGGERRRKKKIPWYKRTEEVLAAKKAEDAAKAEQAQVQGQEQAPESEEEEGEYDLLPFRIADMDKNERIAMEPYPEYDSLLFHEKAELYAHQFFLMYDREPVYSPDTITAIEVSQRATSPIRLRKYIYKPPETAPPKKPEEAELEALAGPWAPEKQKKDDMNLQALPGPWSISRKEEPGKPEEKKKVPVYKINPDGSISVDQSADHRMENLKGYWTFLDTMHTEKDANAPPVKRPAKPLVAK